MSDVLVPAVVTDRAAVFVGDTVAVLPMLDAGSVDSVVTDPPYGLEFCDQDWDGATGFRQSLPDVDTSGMSDAEVFEVWCQAWATGALRVLKPGGHMAVFGGTRTWHRMARGVESAGFEIRDQIAWLYSTGMPKSLDISRAIDQHLGVTRLDRVVEVAEREGVLGRTSKVVAKGQPVTAEAQLFDGFGTALKPGFEPILIARKPVESSIVANVLKYGTGGLNIDGSRFGGDQRWPVNAVLDEVQAALMDLELGDDVSGKFPVFRYEAKASQQERPKANQVAHVTVKPKALMRWLVGLVTPRGGTVLEPFAGSGSTLEAALEGGFKVVGVEKDPSFVPLIQARLERLDHQPLTT